MTSGSYGEWHCGLIGLNGMSAALFMQGSAAFVCDCINSAKYKYVHITYSLLESGDTNEGLGERACHVRLFWGGGLKMQELFVWRKDAYSTLSHFYFPSSPCPDLT